MNKLLTALVAAGALSFAPLGLAETDMNNNLQTTPQHDGTTLTTGDKTDSLKHMEVNLKSNGKEFKAIVPHEHAKDLNQGDQLEVGDSLHKTDAKGTGQETNGIY